MTDVARIRLLWHPQAQFAGYLLAQAEALGAPRGVSIETSPVDFAMGPLEALVAGRVEFAVASPSHLLESPHAGDLTLLLTLQQQSALVYPAHRARGIHRLADLDGRRAGVWPGREDLEFRWMLMRAGLGPTQVEHVPMNDTVGPFLAGTIDVAQMTVYHELHRVMHALGGADKVTLFRAADHGAALIKDGLITTRRLAQAQPEFVQRVVDTVLEGWALALMDEQRAIDACLRAVPTLDPAHQRAQWRDLRTLIASGATATHGLGYPDPAHVARAARAMTDLGHPVEAGTLANAVDDTFWQAAPGKFKALA